jgi:regulator of replication initiation timing
MTFRFNEDEIGVLKVNMEKLILVNQKLLMDISDLRNGMAERRKPNYNEDTRKILSENLKRLLSELWNEK